MSIPYTDLHTKYDLNIFKCRDVKTPEKFGEACRMGFFRT